MESRDNDDVSKTSGADVTAEITKSLNNNDFKTTVGKVAIGAAIGVTAVAAVPYALGAVGFTSAGVAAGSIAAKIMSGAAATGAGGSVVAGMQSVGAAGFSGATYLAAGAAGSTAGSLARFFPLGKRESPDEQHKLVNKSVGGKEKTGNPTSAVCNLEGGMAGENSLLDQKLSSFSKVGQGVVSGMHSLGAAAGAIGSTATKLANLYPQGVKKCEEPSGEELNKTYTKEEHAAEGSKADVKSLGSTTNDVAGNFMRNVQPAAQTGLSAASLTRLLSWHTKSTEKPIHDQGNTGIKRECCEGQGLPQESKANLKNKL